MIPSPSAASQVPLSRLHAVGWILLALALLPGSWLLWRIHQTSGLNAPRFWELLRDEPVFALAMLDFVLTAAWAFLVLWERRPSRPSWRFWLPLIVFCVIPSIGLALAILLEPRFTSPATKPPANS
jgi:hypothetical protein